MAASFEEISEWFDRGVKQKATHLIVVCDTFDHDDYPVLVKKHENVRDVEAEYRAADMQRVMEVYNLKKSKKNQMAKERCFEY